MIRSNRNPLNALDAKPPQDLDAETALLASLMTRQSECDRIQGLVRQVDFYDCDNGKIFHTLLMLHDAGESIDDMTFLKSRFEQMGIKFDVAKMSKILGSAGAPSHAKHYASRIAELAAKRRQLDLAAYIASEAHDGKVSAAEIQSHIEVEVESWDRRIAAKSRPITEVVEDAWRQINESRAHGVGTGFVQVDTDCGLMFAGDLNICAGRPGLGKTAFAQAVATHVARKGKHVEFVSLEMTGEELARRWLCGESGIDNRVLRNNLTLNQHERDNGLATIAKWQNEELSINIWAPFDANYADIRSVAKIAAASHDLGLIIIDYLQLVTPENASIARHEQVASITRRLKNLAKELQCPILLLCQLNRQAEDGKRPNKSMLRESGAIEQDADRIILLHRNSERPNTVECIVDKNRHGPLTSCDLCFENGQFNDGPQ